MKSALGRGLQSLIPQKNSGKQDKVSSMSLQDLNKLKKESIFNVEVDKIVPNSNQPRKEVDQEQLEELAISIKEYGVLQPIIVTKVEKQTDRGRDVEYEIVAGERRWRAAKLVKIPRVPVIIKDNSRQIKFEMALVENVQRKDLNAIETALAYQRLYDEFGLTADQIAKKIGRQRPSISNTMRLLSLPPAAQEAIIDGRITEGHGRAVLMLKIADQIGFMGDIIRGGWSVRRAEDEARKRLEGVYKKSRATGPKSVEFLAMEKKVSEVLGQHVLIHKRGTIQRLTIEFNEKDQLNKIVDHLLKFN